MFAYCGNNPVIFRDSFGESKVWNWLKENIANPVLKSIIEAQFEIVDAICPGNSINVLSQGVNISGGCGIGVSLSLGVSIDREGNVNPTISAGLGGSVGCGIAINKTYSISNATNNNVQKGIGGNIGGSFSVPVYGPVGVGGGIDLSFASDTNVEKPYYSLTASTGVSLGLTPIEFHSQASYTWVLPGCKVSNVFQ